MSVKGHISTKAIPNRERLIVALDVPTVQEAKDLVTTIGDSAVFYKVGLQLFMADGYFGLIDWLRDLDKKVFVDLKFFDIAETIALAVAQLNGRGVSFATVHGNDPMLRAAVGAREEGLQILAVTVLTSLDNTDMKDLGFEVDVPQLVLSRARRATVDIGCDGVISSAQEAPLLRTELGHGFLIVSPGIRPGYNSVENDDQKRVTDVKGAFLNGADYIVVGRPITRDAPDPQVAAEQIQQDIAAVFAQDKA